MADEMAQAVIGRHKKDMATLALTMGDPEAFEAGMEQGVYWAGYNRAIPAAIRMVLQQVASGEVTPETAQAMLDKINAVVL